MYEEIQSLQKLRVGEHTIKTQESYDGLSVPTTKYPFKIGAGFTILVSEQNLEDGGRHIEYTFIIHVYDCKTCYSTLPFGYYDICVVKLDLTDKIKVSMSFWIG